MNLVQQSGRTRKESLIPLRGTEDLKIEILDVNTMSGFTVIDSGVDEIVEVVTSEDSSEAGSSRPRKRAKLDHLTAEQKAQHRKMMNRISAQSARDRQRALMQQQEESLKRVSVTMDQLKEENKSLKQMNQSLLKENAALESLATENAELKKRIAELEDRLKHEESHVPSSEVSSSVCIETSCCSSEPAVPLTVPLPKGLELQLILIFTLLIWECSSGISMLQKFSKFWKPFQNKFSAMTPNLHLSKWTPEDLQKVALQLFAESKLRLKPPD